MLQQSNPEAAERLLRLAKADVKERWDKIMALANAVTPLPAEPIGE
jgi:hypothetical protein